LGGFWVVNPGKQTHYRVVARGDGVFCACDDFNNQLAFFGRGCCKHGYAVLGYLGLGSLADYLQGQKVVPFPRVGEGVLVYAA
jgi:predicted nucleic acid-binding Zn finger protein